MAIIKTTTRKITNAGEDTEEKELFYTAGRNVNLYNHMENSMEIPQK